MGCGPSRVQPWTPNSSEFAVHVAWKENNKFAASGKRYGNYRTLQEAIDADDVTAVVDVLKSNSTQVNVSDGKGNTPLHVAAQRNNIKVTKLLLDAGATLHNKNKEGYLAWHLAAMTGSQDVCTLLLANGGDDLMSKRCRIGQYTAVHLARQSGNFDLYSVVDKVHRIWTDAAQEIGGGGVDGLKPLINQYLCPSSRLFSHPGQPSLLQAAVQAGNLEACKLLLEGGADPSVDDMAALKIARQRQDAPAFRVLTLWLPDVNARMESGEQLSHLAARACTPVLQSLLEHGVVNAAMADGLQCTALHVAARHGSPGNCGAILEHYKERRRLKEALSAVNSDGLTATHQAVGKCNAASTLLMVECQADCGARDGQGNSPLHLAAANGCTAITALLLLYNADPMLTNAAGKTAVQLSTCKDVMVLMRAVCGDQRHYWLPYLQTTAREYGIYDPGTPEDRAVRLEAMAKEAATHLALELGYTIRRLVHKDAQESS